MPKKVRNADLAFASIKRKSPGIPPDTCPYLDRMIEVVEDLSALVKDNKTGIANELTTLIKNELEYVRKANETLRESSKYWYDRHKEAFYKPSRRKRVNE